LDNNVSSRQTQILAQNWLQSVTTMMYKKWMQFTILLQIQETRDQAFLLIDDCFYYWKQ